MAFSPSPALIAKFRAIAEQRLDRIAQELSRFKAEETAADEIRTLGRELHTLKGESGMLGFKGAFEVARALEQVLPIAYRGGRSNAQCVQLLERGLALMLQLVTADPAQASPEVTRFVGDAEAAAAGYHDA